MSRRPPLSARDVKRGLSAAGFVERPRTGTSHVQWVRTDERGYKRVTVSEHLEPFSIDLIKLMASQAGMSVSQFYEICSKDGQKKASKNLLPWLLNLFD